MQGASKGAAVDRILKKLADEGNAPDFVLCIGDDRSDEDMFTAMEHVTFSPHLTTEVNPPSQAFPLPASRHPPCTGPRTPIAPTPSAYPLVPPHVSASPVLVVVMEHTVFLANPGAGVKHALPVTLL